MADDRSTPAEALGRAITAFKAGRFAEVERVCRQIVVIKPDLFDALRLLAIANARLGKAGEALANYDRAVAARPDHVGVLSARGSILHELERYEDALVSFERALALDPDHVETLVNRGRTLRRLKRFEEALASYDRALAIRPDIAEALSNRGNTLHDLKRFDEALASYDRALAVRPNYAGVFFNRGNTLRALKRDQEAVSSYDRALSLRPDYGEALFNRGNALQKLKRFEEAIESYDRVLTLRPDDAATFSNRGNALQKLGRFDEALASYDRALAMESDFAEAFCNRAAALQELQRFDEALASCDTALSILPNYPEALFTRGNILRELHRFDEALTNYAAALAERADFADAHFNEALCRLLTGDFRYGLEKYEWRWELEGSERAKHDFARPQWNGADDLAGKTILLHAEQGFGDTIQFCRYAPLVAARGARVILEVQRPLRELVQSLADVGQIVSEGDQLPDFDVHAPLLSLPLAFDTRAETIPSQAPYLAAPPGAAERWERQIGANRRRKIGLVWAGHPTHKYDRFRSIPLRALLPLLDIDATFVSLHKDVRPSDAAVLNERSNILHFGDDLKDFSDTAALISNLDLVISVDTAVAHLAGAMAVTTWVLLPFSPDWRWLLGRDDSPWYPSIRLFRQDESRTWDSAVARIRDTLRELPQ